MEDTKYKAIECKLCGKKFLRITNTHLWKEHDMTMEEYKAQFPDAPIDAKGLAEDRVSHLRDHTYEQAYGDETAKKVKRMRSTAAKKQIEINGVRTGPKEEPVSDETRSKISVANTKHGATTYRRRALEHYGLECARCSYTSEDPKEFIVHHKDFNNFPSELGNHSIENLMVLCKDCHAVLHNEISEVSGKFAGISSIEKGMHYILIGLRDEFGLDLKDENFRDTPKRVARAYSEIFEGVKNTDKKVKRILNSGFPCEYDQMIIAANVEVYSMCPHHFLPVKYSISAAYLPSKKTGKVIGISKLSRIIEILAKRPVLHEQLVMDIADALMTLQGCQGAAVIANGVHYCMVMRGVKQPHSNTVMSAMRGVFLEEAIVRQEFMQLMELRSK